jgi:iron complex outermembrane receptor protein
MTSSKTFKAACLGAASYLAISVDLCIDAHAQSSLPPVTVDAPTPQTRRSVPKQNATRSRLQSRRQVAATRQASSPAIVPSTSTLGPPPPAYAGGQVATGGQMGLLGNRPVMNTPFNVTNYTSKTIEDQQARTVGDLLANDPSVRSNWPRGSYAENFTIRGFNVSNPNIALNGMYGILPHDRIPIEMAERVEVLKGPSALLYGQSPGGVVGGNINIVPKRAEDEPIARLTGSFFSDGQPYGHADVGRRFGDDKEFGVRVNAAYRNGKTPIDLQREEVGVGTVALDYRSERFRIALDAGYQHQDYLAPLRYATLGANIPVPATPNASANFHAPWTRVTQDELFGVVRSEFDLAPGITAYAAAGGRNFNSDNLLADPAIFNAKGDFSAFSYWFPYDIKAHSEEAGIRADFQAGPIGHEFRFAATNLEREFFSSFNATGTFLSNLYKPVYPAQPSLAGLSSSPPRTSKEGLSSVAVADTLSFFDKHVLLTLGGRFQKVESASFNGTTGAVTASYDRQAITPAVGLVLKPWSNVSLYANYIEGLTTGPTAPSSADNRGQIFPPTISRQVETGVKVDHGRFTTTLSVFQITQPSAFADPTTNVFGVRGEQRNRGIEVQTFGEVYPGIRVLGGVMFLDGRQTKTAGGVTDGLKAIGVPDHNVNFGAEWDVPWLRGFTVTGRAIYTSSQFYDLANTQSIPDWTRFDIGARYLIARPGGKPIILRAAIENLFDENYWASTNGARLTIGAPRTYLLSTTFQF